MKIIDDKIIDAVIESLDTLEDEYDRQVSEFYKQQPVIASFMESEQTGILSDEERDFLEYLALVIYKAVEKVEKKVPAVSEEQLEEVEEKNWDMLENAKGKTFTDRVDVFFEDYEQEDLLAFVEDSLVFDPDDDEANMDFLTDEGREPMFVILKTIIDALESATSK
ncbi:MAG: hypothetical protein ACOYOA_14505 [Saprospiraceae bacterium]